MIVVVGLIIGWATLNSAVKVNAQKNDEQDTKIQSLEILLQRIIVLEEHDKNFTEDLSEIKGDVKLIKGALGAN